MVKFKAAGTKLPDPGAIIFIMFSMNGLSKFGANQVIRHHLQFGCREWTLNVPSIFTLSRPKLMYKL